MAHRSLCESPKVLLTRGNHVMTLGPPERVFVVRTVVYDSEVPVYTIPGMMEQRYYGLQDMKGKCPQSLFDSPVLDLDHNLRVYEP